MLGPSQFGKGTVKFVGSSLGRPGLGELIGIALDSPSSVSSADASSSQSLLSASAQPSSRQSGDGSLDGVRYFETPPNQGIFVKRTQVKLINNK